MCHNWCPYESGEHARNRCARERRTLAEGQDLLRSLPTAEIPDEVWAKWSQQQKEEYSRESLDALVEKGLVKVTPPDRIRFGEDVELAITFVRTEPRVDVEFKRMWDMPDTAFQMTFYPARREPTGFQALRVAATLTQHAIFGAARIFIQQQQRRPKDRVRA